MKLKKKTANMGMWVGIIFGLITMVVGILFITDKITYQISGQFFGWFLVILAAGMGLEYFITRAYKIY